MTAKEFTERLNQKIKDIETTNIPLMIAARNAAQMQAKRIFQDGLKTDGSKIGSYNSTKPIYISPDQAPIKVNQKGKNGKKIKSGYYSSYKEFRKQQGRESEFVNVRLTNDLQSDFSNAQISKTSTAIGPVKPIKVDTNTYKLSLKRDININKKEGLEDKYGEIFKPSKEEKEHFYKVLVFEYRNALR